MEGKNTQVNLPASKLKKVSKPKKGKEGKKTSKKPKPISKIGSGSVIALFNKTPPARGPNDAVCPHFWEFKPFNGCRFDCQWCYLNGTFFRWKGLLAKEPHLKNERGVMADLENALQKIPGPQMFNCGELADGLLFEAILLNKVIPMFAKYYNEAERKKAGTGHKLLILTKSDDTTVMKRATARNSVVFAHSVNAAYVSRTWEIRAPHPWYRLDASRQANKFGFETRLRIDPMVPVHNWKVGYRALCEKIMEHTPNVSVITLGSLRGLQSTINACIKMGKDRSWMSYLSDETSWGKRIPEDQRVEMYTYVIRTLKDLGYADEISLCKETLGVWARLKKDKVIDYGPGDVRCNCIL